MRHFSAWVTTKRMRNQPRRKVRGSSKRPRQKHGASLFPFDATFVSRFRPSPNSFRSVARWRELPRASNFVGSTTASGWLDENSHNFPTTLRMHVVRENVTKASTSTQGQTCARSNASYLLETTRFFSLSMSDLNQILDEWASNSAQSTRHAK